MKYFFLLFVCTYWHAGSYAQDPLKNLMDHPKGISYIKTEKNRFFSEADTAFKTHFFTLITSNNNLYAWVNGTGRLYKAVQRDTGIAFTRIDSTTHFGYNIAAFPFSYHGNIYTLGGYGLWRINGQSRVYNEKASQWDIVKLNEEVPLMFDDFSNLMWYNKQAGVIYLGYATYKNEAVSSKEMDDVYNDFQVRKLDLQTKNWTIIGQLNNQIADKIQNIGTIGMSPWGQVIILGGKISLLDFQHNRLSSLNPEKANYQSIIRNWYNYTFYFRDSTLYFGSIKEHKLDSFMLHANDFDKAEATVYQPIEQSQSTVLRYFIAVIGLTAIFLIGWLFNRRYRIIILKRNHLLFKAVSNSIEHPVLDEREKLLLKILLGNSEKNKVTTIEEINQVLGLSRRTIEVQKKQRSDTITSINKKYSAIYRTRELLIQKHRSESDKRTFEYFISIDHLESVKELLQ